MSEDTNPLARYKKSMDASLDALYRRMENMEAVVGEAKAIRPRKILPDMDAIDEMVQKGIKVIEEVQEIIENLKSHGGIELSVTPQGPTQVSVPTVKINVPL